MITYTKTETKNPQLYLALPDTVHDNDMNPYRTRGQEPANHRPARDDLRTQKLVRRMKDGTDITN